MARLDVYNPEMAGKPTRGLFSRAGKAIGDIATAKANYKQSQAVDDFLDKASERVSIDPTYNYEDYMMEAIRKGLVNDRRVKEYGKMVQNQLKERGVQEFLGETLGEKVQYQRETDPDVGGLTTEEAQTTGIAKELTPPSLLSETKLDVPPQSYEQSREAAMKLPPEQVSDPRVAGALGISKEEAISTGEYKEPIGVKEQADIELVKARALKEDANRKKALKEIAYKDFKKGLDQKRLDLNKAKFDAEQLEANREDLEDELGFLRELLLDEGKALSKLEKDFKDDLGVTAKEVTGKKKEVEGIERKITGVQNALKEVEMATRQGEKLIFDSYRVGPETITAGTKPIKVEPAERSPETQPLQETGDKRQQAIEWLQNNPKYKDKYNEAMIQFVMKKL